MRVQGGLHPKAGDGTYLVQCPTCCRASIALPTIALALRRGSFEASTAKRTHVQIDEELAALLQHVREYHQSLEKRQQNATLTAARPSQHEHACTSSSQAAQIPASLGTGVAALTGSTARVCSTDQCKSSKGTRRQHGDSAYARHHRRSSKAQAQRELTNDVHTD